MIRVPFEVVRVESESRTKAYIKMLNVRLPLSPLTKKSGEIILQLPVLEIHFSSFFACFLSSSPFLLSLLVRMREIIVRVFPRPISSAAFRKKNKANG